MTESMHPNMSLMMKLDIQNLEACRDLFADDFTWHYFNPELPELEGEYRGVEGLKKFFAELGGKSNRSFQVNPIDGHPAGDELVVTQVCNRMELDGRPIEFDAVVVWRIVNSKIAEGWDIPAINTIRIQNEVSRGVLPT